MSLPSAADLRRAARLREEIDARERELNQILAGLASPPNADRKAAPKRHMSAATKAKIAKAMRRRHKMRRANRP